MSEIDYQQLISDIQTAKFLPYAPPLLCVSEAVRWLGKLHWIFTIPIPMGRTVSYGCIIIQICRSWQNDHSTSRSRIIAWIARFFRLWRTVSAGSLHIKRIWLLYSVVKELPTVFASLWKSTTQIMDFHRLTSGAEERGKCSARLND